MFSAPVLPQSLAAATLSLPARGASVPVPRPGLGMLHLARMARPVAAAPWVLGVSARYVYLLRLMKLLQDLV